MSNKKFVWIFILFLPLAALSQEKAAFAIQFDDQPLTEVLSILEQTFDVRFSFQDVQVKDLTVSLDTEIRTLANVLAALERNTGLVFQAVDSRYVIVFEDSTPMGEIQRLEDVVVRGYLSKGISKNKEGVFRIKPEELNTLPGLTQADILESIQQLPGVISTNETASGFSVRGGAADQNSVIWDGINIYHKGHLFGMISPFNPNSISDVSFSNKGTHPRFGERVSGVIDITSKEHTGTKVTGGLGVNGLNADAFLGIPIWTEKLNLFVSFRQSYTEPYESFTFDKLSDKVFQNTKIMEAENTNNEFDYSDYTVKLTFLPNPNNHFTLSTIQINNRLDYVVKDVNSTASFNDILKIKNEGYSIHWNKTWSQQVQQNTQAVLSKYRFFYNFIEEEALQQGRNFEKKNIIFDSGISSEVQITTAKGNRTAFGYQYTIKDVSYAFLESAELSFILDTDKRVERTHSVYGNYFLRNPKLFDLSAGFRVNYYKGLDAIRFEPRLVLYKELIQNVKLQLSGEIKNQVISEIDETILSDLTLENQLWRLADGETFPIINSKQVSAGLLYNSKGWTMDLDHYYKKIEGLTALSLGFLNPLDSDFHIGEQRIVGVDFYAKKDFRSVNMWLSYSFSQVESKFEGLNDEAYFTSSTNVKHAFNTSVAYLLKRFQFSIAWNWRSGLPYTEALVDPVDGALFFEDINTARLPDYHRLDFSSTYEFQFSEKNKLKGKAGFSIRNLYDQKNHLSREYSGNNSLNDPVTVVDKFSLGFTPNFLFRVYW